MVNVPTVMITKQKSAIKLSSFFSRNATNRLDKLVKELDKEVRMGGGHFHHDITKQMRDHSTQSGCDFLPDFR